MKRGIISVTNNELTILQNLAKVHEKLQSLAGRLGDTDAPDSMDTAHQANNQESEKITIQISAEEAEVILDSLGMANTEDEKKLRSELLAFLHE